MSHLIDTNILTRLIALKDPLSPAARTAIDREIGSDRKYSVNPLATGFELWHT